jgi:hypothetical protein
VSGVGNIISGSGFRAVDSRANAPTPSLYGSNLSGWTYHAKVTFVSYLQFHPLAAMWLGIATLLLLSFLWSRRRRTPSHPYPASTRWRPQGTPVAAAAASAQPAQPEPVQAVRAASMAQQSSYRGSRAAATEEFSRPRQSAPFDVPAYDRRAAFEPSQANDRRPSFEPSQANDRRAAYKPSQANDRRAAYDAPAAYEPGTPSLRDGESHPPWSTTPTSRLDQKAQQSDTFDVFSPRDRPFEPLDRPYNPPHDQHYNRDRGADRNRDHEAGSL